MNVGNVLLLCPPKLLMEVTVENVASPYVCLTTSTTYLVSHPPALSMMAFMGSPLD